MLQEDPGESLSDSEKEEEGNLDEGSLKVDGDDEESEDDFFVPDGYLSENEVEIIFSLLNYKPPFPSNHGN